MAQTPREEPRGLPGTAACARHAQQRMPASERKDNAVASA